MRRSREDISVPSLIPKLLSTRGKEERLKRQDSKDDIRHSSKIARKEPLREESSSSKPSSMIVSPTSGSKDEGGKSGIRVSRRDNGREDVGRNSSVKDSGKVKQQEKQERTESVGGADDADDADDAEESLSRSAEAVTSIEQVDADGQRGAKMLDVIVAENRMQDDRVQEQRTMLVGEEKIEAKYMLAADREPVESVAENDKERDNDEEDARDIAERLLDVSSDGDVTGGTAGERKGLVDIGYGKKPDEFQVVSEFICE